MSTLRNLNVLVVLSCVTAGSVAQDAGQEPAQPPAQEEERAPATPPAEDESEATPAADDSFTPSEEVLADEEVTFPVDI